MIRASRTAPLIIALLWSLAGCANLNVNVDLYAGPRATVTRATAQRVVNTVLTHPEFVPELRAERDAQARKALGELMVKDQAAKLVANGASTQDAQTAARNNWSEFNRQIQTRQDELIARGREVLAAARNTQNSLASGGAFATDLNSLLVIHDRYVDERMQASYDIWKSIAQTFCDSPCMERDQMRTLTSEALSTPTGNIVSRVAASARTQGRVVGYPIFDPDFEQLRNDTANWKPFYSGKFASWGGSARFVVVRQGLVIFDQKSLDFDPTPAIGAATAIAKVGLQVAAAKALGRAAFTSPGAPAEGGAAQQVTDTQLVNETKVRAQQLALTERNEARIQALTLLAQLLKRFEGGTTLDAAQLAQAKKEFDSILHQYEGRLAATEVPP